MKIYKCKICDKEISRYSAHYGLGMCLSCSHKGKKLTKETIEKRSKSNKGKKRTKSACENMSKAQKKRYQDPKERKKISKANKGKPKSKQHRENLSKSCIGRPSGMLGKHHNKDTRKKISLGHGGTGTPFENLDLASSIRKSSKYNNWRIQVFKLDNFTCQECGLTNCKLEAHHIKEFSKLFKNFLNKYFQYNLTKDKQTLLNLATKYKPFWKLNNGQTLCKDCHNLTKIGEENGREENGTM
jgi:hypothetical protein